MLTDLQIPDEAICHICGKPMRVVRSEERARALGLRVPEGGITTIQCHDYYLTIEDEDVAQEIIKLLDAYHAAADSVESGEPAQQNGANLSAGTQQQAIGT